MNKPDNLKQLIKRLIGNGIAKNQEDLGKVMGYPNKSYFSQILNGHVPIPSDFYDKLYSLDKNLEVDWKFKNSVIEDAYDKLNSTLLKTNEPMDTTDYIELQKTVISLQKAEIDRLSREVGELKEKVSFFETQSLRLKNI